VRGIGVTKCPHPRAQRCPAGIVPRDHGELARNDLHIVQRIPQQGLEQVFLVREVQVKRTVRGLGPADDIVHPHAMEPPLLELDHACFE